MNASRLAMLAVLATLTMACADSTLDDPAAADQNEALTGVEAANLRAMVKGDPLTPSVAAICQGRVDALCAALGDLQRDPAAASARARDVVQARFAAEPRGAVLDDPAVRLYLRERVHALHAMLAVTDDQDGAPSDFATRVDAHVSKHHSLYDRSAFAAARGWLPPRLPAQRCDVPAGLLLVFPGVIRLPSKAELEGQIRAVTAVLPCLRVERVDTGTFVDLATNASKGREAVARVDATLGRQLPIHVLGYSQGATNGLAMLASSSALAARTRTFVALSPATHGAESADALLNALGVYQERPDAGCGDLAAPLRDLCRQVASSSLAPVASFMQAMLERMGAHFDDIPGSTVGGWLETHIAGLRSLSTGGTARFWADAGPKLPRDTAYITFRSVITDERKMLPATNWLSYQTIWRSSPTAPFNDMQVRLANLPLGGPIADREVVLRVADGNHWMWELTPSDVPSHLMSPEMFAGVPRNELVVAQYVTLAEVGLLFGGS